VHLICQLLLKGMHSFTNSGTCMHCYSILIREQQKEAWKVGFVYLSVLQAALTLE